MDDFLRCESPDLSGFNQVPIALLVLNDGLSKDHETIVGSSKNRWVFSCRFSFTENDTLRVEFRKNDEKWSQVKEVKDKVRHDIGAIASLSGATVVEQLPKTRSGKVWAVACRSYSNSQKLLHVTHEPCETTMACYGMASLHCMVAGAEKKHSWHG